jgi:hypothetical protein
MLRASRKAPSAGNVDRRRKSVTSIQCRYTLLAGHGLETFICTRLGPIGLRRASIILTLDLVVMSGPFKGP